MTELTVIFFSCRRTHLLHQSIKAFLEHNTYPLYDFIIVNDSADAKIHDDLRKYFPGATLVLNERNVGLIESIDRGYAHIKTEYFFHCEDDWMLTRGSFIENSFTVMEAHPEIEEVWPTEFNKHPSDPEIYKAGNLEYKLMSQFYLKGEDGPFGWSGFSTAISLKRMSDYRKVAPYHNIPYDGNIWMREQAIGERYRLLGYRTGVFLDNYAINIGYGQSEYTINGNNGSKDK